MVYHTNNVKRDYLVVVFFYLKIPQMFNILATCNLEYELTTNFEMVQYQINFHLDFHFHETFLYFKFIMLISRIYNRIRYNNGLYLISRVGLCAGYVAICNHVCLISKVPFRVNFQIHHFICLFYFPSKNKKIHCAFEILKTYFRRSSK